MSAAKSDTRSDILQILALTFGLCALAFGGWGIFLYSQVSKLEAECKADKRFLTQDWPRDSERNAEAAERYIRNKELESVDSIARVVYKELKKLPGGGPPDNKIGFRNDPKGSELICNVELPEMDETLLLRVIENVQRARDFHVPKFRISRKYTEKTKSLPTKWRVDDLRFTAYVKKED